VGRGSTFSIFLPLVAGAAAAVAAAGAARLSMGGTERLLLVEDEERLRNLLARALRDRGYKVAVVASAEEALIVLEQQSFDLLLSDIVLPGMHGGALVRVARERWPRMALTLMSGYSGSADIPADMPLLSKPFTLDRLASHVRHVLDGVALREL
jgi:two-component system cell cycle sensor histidine kinase/response regulator CckA